MVDGVALGVGASIEQPNAFDALLAAVGIASLIVVAGERMGPGLRITHDPADVVQEAILVAWRSRAGYRHQSLAAARSWLLKIIDHRICDLARHESRLKRGGDRVPLSLEVLPEGGRRHATGGLEWAPVRSTTPSRMALQREWAEKISEALGTLDEFDRALVMMIVLEVVGMREAARRLQISESSARSRLRRVLCRIGTLLPGHEQPRHGQPGLRQAGPRVAG